jgi:alpha-mannosidase
MSRFRWHLIGHAHIDAEWLWTFDETLKVCEDTFRSVLNFMLKYPGFTFCQSSACYYEAIEKIQPELFEEIKKRVNDGRWEIVGGSWVEFDSNMPSGESLARQFLYGQRYFREKFGFYVEVGWLPDSFGFAWTLPQIMAKSGIKYFLTQKLSWNDMMYYPFYVFLWESPDGTKILSHQTVGSYSEEIKDENLGRFNRQSIRLRLLHGMDDLLILYGVGDHGGGPRRGDLETILRWAGSANLPAEVGNIKALDYFKILEGYLGRVEIPVVSDELYLQFHRGVFTTQSRFKQTNRKSEVLIDSVERFSTIASLLGGKYPREELRERWKKILLHQFHDTMSGSGIKEVYEDCERDFRELEKFAFESLNAALTSIASKVDTQGEGTPLLVFNPLSWERSGAVHVELEDGEGPCEVIDSFGNSVPCQPSEDGKKVLFIANVPSLGYSLYRLKRSESWKTYQTDIKACEDGDKITLENLRLRISVDKHSGIIKEIYDKDLGLNFIDDGGLRIQIFEDYPRYGRKTLFYDFDAVSCDAWEVYIYQQPGGVKYVELKKAEEVKLLENGPVRATVLVKYRFRQEGREDSTFTIYVRLYSNMPMLHMDFDVDWHAAHRMAKLAVPAIFQSDFNTCEIPYGYVRRRNPLSPEATLYERAKYEVPCQKWIDYSSEDEAYGLSILNDSKYGYDQANNIIRISLLRSPAYPPRWGETGGLEGLAKEREIADQGKHRFSIALYPHKGCWRKAQTVRKAYELNYPLIVKIESEHYGDLPVKKSFLEVKPENVIVSALKMAEDDNNVIIRVYEAHGSDCEAEIAFPWKIKEAYETDILEREVRKVDSPLKMPIGRCEIKTLKLKLS